MTEIHYNEPGEHKEFKHKKSMEVSYNSIHRMVLNYNEPPMRIQDLILLLNKKYPLIHGKGRVAKITNNMF